MSTSSDLRDYFNTQAASITDTGDRLEALDDISTWYNTRVAIATLSSTEITSYSIGGRSVTRQNLPQLRSEEVAQLSKVKAWIGRGGSALADLRYDDLVSGII